jgi:hypothetical protein
MRFTWIRKQQSPQFASDRMHFVMWDFLKMFTAAILMGAIFSVMAAGVVLMLSRSSDANAEASWIERDGLLMLRGEVAVEKATQHNVGAKEGLMFAALNAESITELTTTDENFGPTPGSLYLGDGCGSDPLTAIEREWFVTVEQDYVDVRVMQTFQLPEAEGDAVKAQVLSTRFYAQLPKGARYASFRVDTDSGVLLGRYSDDADWDADDLKTVRDLAKRGQIRVFEYQNPVLRLNTLSSDLIDGVLANQTVVVSYRYQMPIDQFAKTHQLAIVLGESALDESRDDTFSATAQHDLRGDHMTDLSHELIDATPTRPIAAGTVWVEWKAHAPRELSAMPSGSVVERESGKSTGKVTGMSWTTPRIASLDQFQLTWTN